jgi:hypothetical protein
MRGLALLPVLLCTAASAQNWALLNPAYKYNYSLGGTDTITNQIFITHIDTLGVDSFRYELNTIAELCDTCVGPDLYIRTNSPQFLQRTVNVGSGIWHFHDPGSYVVIPEANVGSSWLFDSLANVTATVISVDTLDQFGSSVARKTITLSDGGQLMISEAYGVLERAGRQLLGVHGPNVGVLTPSVQQFYGFQPGDVACYNRSYGEATGWPPVLAESHGTYIKRTILSRTEFPDHIGFGYQGVGCYSWNIQYQNSSDWGGDCGAGSGTWTLPGIGYAFDEDPFEVLPFHDLIGSYPGQVILDTSFIELWAAPMLVVAEHYLDEEGRYVIRAKKFRDPDGDLYGWWANPSNEVEPSLFELSYDENAENNGVMYRERVGLIGYWGNWFESGEILELTGAVIDGDTTGSVSSDSELLDVNENQPCQDIKIYPNPSSDLLMLALARPSRSAFRIFTMLGGVVLSGQLGNKDRYAIDVSGLPIGSYLVEVVTSTRVVHERFIISR